METKSGLRSLARSGVTICERPFKAMPISTVAGEAKSYAKAMSILMT